MKRGLALEPADRLGAAVFIAAWLLYGLTAPEQYSYDGLCYALDVERAPAANLFHANYLLYSAVQRGALRAAQLIGYSGRAIELMQSLNALAAGLAAGLFARLAARAFGWRRALVAAAVFATSHALWIEAADPGSYAWAALASAALLDVLLRFQKTPPAWLGVLHGAAALFHQMLALVAAAFIASYWLEKRPRGERPPRSCAYLAAATLAAALPYAAVAALFHGGSLSEALTWAFSPGGTPQGVAIRRGFWWSWDAWRNLEATAIAFARAFVAPVPDAGWFNTLAGGVVFAALAWTAVRSAGRMRRDSGGLDAPLWAWIAALSVFQFFFNVGMLRYRILLMPPLLYLAAAALPDDLRALRPAALGALLASGINYRYAVGPKRAPGSDAVRTAWLQREVGPRDFLLFEGGGGRSITNVHLAYFAPGVPARSLRGYLLGRPDGDLEPLKERVRTVLSSGGRFLVERRMLEPQHRPSLLEILPSNKGWVDWLASFRVARILPGPAGYDLAEVAGFRAEGP